MTNIDTLLNQLEADDVMTRREATQAFWEIQDERALHPLLKRLKDEDADVRRNAIQALRQLNHDEAIPSMIRMLKDSDNRVRRRATAWLMSIPTDPRLIDPLIAILMDEDNSLAIRDLAAMLLGGMDDKRVVQPLCDVMIHGNPKLRRRITHSLFRQRDPHSVTALAVALEDEDVKTQQIAKKTLQNIDTPQANQILSKQEKM